jgi:hypothetical protein
MSVDKRSESLSRIDSAVLVLLLTAWAYALAFAYESHYLGWFGIPAALVEVNLRALLYCAGTILVLAFGAYLLLYSIGQFVPRLIRLEIQEDTALIALWLIGLTLLGRYLQWPWLVDLFFILPIALTFMTFVVPTFEPRPRACGYWARVEALALYRRSLDEQIERAGGRSPFPLTMVRTIGVRSFWVLVVVVCSIYAASMLGEREAFEQTAYLMSAENGGCIVLRSRSEGLLCAAVDWLHPGQLLGEYRFLKPECTPLELRSIGRLFLPSAVPRSIGDNPLRLPINPLAASAAVGQSGCSASSSGQAPQDKDAPKPTAH